MVTSSVQALDSYIAGGEFRSCTQTLKNLPLHFPLPHFSLMLITGLAAAVATIDTPGPTHPSAPVRGVGVTERCCQGERVRRTELWKSERVVVLSSDLNTNSQVEGAQAGLVM